MDNTHGRQSQAPKNFDTKRVPKEQEAAQIRKRKASSIYSKRNYYKSKSKFEQLRSRGYDLRAENEALKAENQRLEALWQLALQAVVNYHHRYPQYNPPPLVVGAPVQLLQPLPPLVSGHGQVTPSYNIMHPNSFPPPHPKNTLDDSLSVALQNFDAGSAYNSNMPCPGWLPAQALTSRPPPQPLFQPSTATSPPNAGSTSNNGSDNTPFSGGWRPSSALATSAEPQMMMGRALPVADSGPSSSLQLQPGLTFFPSPTMTHITDSSSAMLQPQPTAVQVQQSQTALSFNAAWPQSTWERSQR